MSEAYSFLNAVENFCPSSLHFIFELSDSPAKAVTEAQENQMTRKRADTFIETPFFFRPNVGDDLQPTPAAKRQPDVGCQRRSNS